MIRGLLSPKRVVALVLALAIVAGLIVSSMYLDHRADRRRPMYRAMIHMQQLQWDLLRAGKHADDIVVHHRSGPQLINGKPYITPHGVTVKVENRGGSTCVFAENQFGDHSAWECVDTSAARPTLGGLQ